MALERASDSTRWQSLVETLSRQNAHGSWRRAALLALVRSEVGAELLKRASSLLLANRGSLLRELIRTVMAVDVQPASKILTAVGIDAITIPPSLHVPSGPSWYRLIGWVLIQGESIPAAAIPDVVDLYSAWSIGMLGLDHLTPVLMRRLFSWLTEIETARDVEYPKDHYEPFGGEMDHERVRSLETDLRIRRHRSLQSICNSYASVDTARMPFAVS